MLNCKPFIFIAVALMVSAAVSAQAQTPKYGHMNLGNLVEMLPDSKKAEAELKVFADKYSAKDDSLTKAFQTAYSKLEEEYNAGTLTPVVVKQRQEELQKQQEFIQKFEEDAQNQVTAKRQQLLEPILKRVEDAIKAVAVENGYLMIFDTSVGVMLYAADSEDVTALVKKKLGL